MTSARVAMPAMLPHLARARAALARTGTAASALAFQTALAAGSDEAVSRALAPLADAERFTAMIAVGLLRPSRLSAATEAFLAGSPNFLCETRSPSANVSLME